MTAPDADLTAAAAQLRRELATDATSDRELNIGLHLADLLTYMALPWHKLAAHNSTPGIELRQADEAMLLCLEIARAVLSVEAVSVR